MGVLEKITANMELAELKKFKLQKAILAMMLEWKHLEEYMDSTQHSFQECLIELQLKEKYLNSVQESALESNKEMESIRVSIEGKFKELDNKERDFLVFRDEQVNAFDLKEKQLGLIGNFIEERFKMVELREEKLAAKQKVVEGIFNKFKVEEKQFEDTRKYVGERIEEINTKGMQLEKRCKELESKEKELGDRAREIESKAKQISMVNPDNARAQKRNESRSAHSALLGESYVDALVQGEVEAPPTIAVAAGKGEEKAAEAYESRSKRAASPGVMAARKRRCTLNLADEEGNEVQVIRVVAVDKDGRDSSAQRGEDGEEDLLDPELGGLSPKVDAEVGRKISTGAVDDDLLGTFNACSRRRLESLGFTMSELAPDLWFFDELDKRYKDCEAEKASKLKAEQLAWEAEHSKLQGEIDKANELLTELAKVKRDLERSQAANAKSNREIIELKQQLAKAQAAKCSRRGVRNWCPVIKKA